MEVELEMELELELRLEVEAEVPFLSCEHPVVTPRTHKLILVEEEYLSVLQPAVIVVLECF